MAYKEPLKDVLWETELSKYRVYRNYPSRPHSIPRKVKINLDEVYEIRRKGFVFYQFSLSNLCFMH